MKEVKKVASYKGTVKSDFKVRGKQYIKGGTYDAKTKDSFDYLVQINKLEPNGNR